MQATTPDFTVEEQALLSLLAWRVLLGRAQHVSHTQKLLLRPGERFSVMDHQGIYRSFRVTLRGSMQLLPAAVSPAEGANALGIQSGLRNPVAVPGSLIRHFKRTMERKGQKIPATRPVTKGVGAQLTGREELQDVAIGREWEWFRARVRALHRDSGEVPAYYVSGVEERPVTI